MFDNLWRFVKQWRIIQGPLNFGYKRNDCFPFINCDKNSKNRSKSFRILPVLDWNLFFLSKAMHSVSLCRGLSLLLLLAQLAIADDSLSLEDIDPGDTPHHLSLSTFSPPDGSLSSENLGMDAASEPSTADGGNWGKAQGSFKNGDSLELASGAGNCNSDAGNTRNGRRRLRRDNDFCSPNYSQFKPSLPKVSHDPGFGGRRWRGHFRTRPSC